MRIAAVVRSPTTVSETFEPLRGPPFMTHSGHYSFARIAILFFPLWLGCSQRTAVVDVSDQTMVANADVLGVTADYLFSEQQYALSEIEEKVSSGLSRWLSAEKELVEQTDWQPDPLLQTLPASVQPVIQDLSSENFKTTDAHYLQGRIWLKALADTIVARPLAKNFWPPLSNRVGEIAAAGTTEDPFSAALREVHPELDDNQIRQLVQACQLFDWTVRNILLLEPTSWPDAKSVSENSVVDDPSLWPPSCGVAGPGYRRSTWQLLMYGRGDAIERSRVFVQLAEQLGIDAVVLAFQSPSDSAPPDDPMSIWIPAVVIGDELFLFDPRLGLPLPCFEDGRMTRLSDIRANPDLLKNLNLRVDESTSDDSKYWLSAETLGAPVIALIDAPLESLTKRMAILERSLSGKQRIHCALHPSSLAERLKANGQVDEVRLLPTEFYVHQFRDAVRAAYQQIGFNVDLADKLAWMIQDEDYIDNFVRFRTAKCKYFLNDLDSPPGVEAIGAKEMFALMIVRYTDELINNLQDNENILFALGLQREGMPALEYQRRLEAIKSRMRLVRGDAVYYLSLCHLETANPSTALVWLNRVAALDDRAYWKSGVPYLKGRSYELLDQLDQAIDQYQIGKDDEKFGPQQHGNLLRARMLKSLLPSKASLEPIAAQRPRRRETASP